MIAYRSLVKNTKLPIIRSVKRIPVGSISSVFIPMLIFAILIVNVMLVYPYTKSRKDIAFARGCSRYVFLPYRMTRRSFPVVENFEVAYCDAS